VDDLPETIADDKLKSAVEAVLARHPAPVVAVYLNAFSAMNETRWANLDALLHEDTRLQF